MGKKDTAAKADETTEEKEVEKGQGRAVILPNGQRRIDYIRDRYYTDGVKRGDIRKEVNAMYMEGEPGEIPYQIVFAATKGKGGDPRIEAANKAKAEAEAAAAAKGDEKK